jgi:hypothetical protein
VNLNWRGFTRSLSTSLLVQQQQQQTRYMHISEQCKVIMQVSQICLRGAYVVVGQHSIHMSQATHSRVHCRAPTAVYLKLHCASGRQPHLLLTAPLLLPAAAVRLRADTVPQAPRPARRSAL